MTRKENERDANDFDLQLYRLITRAQQRSESGDAYADRWSTVFWALVDARPTVRGMMAAEDRAITS